MVVAHLGLRTPGRVAVLLGAMLLVGGAPVAGLAAGYNFTTIVDNGGPNPQFTAIGQRKINDSGEVAFLAEPSFASHRIYKGNGGPLTLIAPGSFWGLDGVGNGAITNSGEVFFRGGVTNVTVGIHRGSGGATTPVVIGDQDMSTAGIKTYFSEISTSNSGNIAYRESTKVCDENFLCGTSVDGYYAIIGGSGTTIAQQGATWSSIPSLAPVINDSGQVAFTATNTSNNKTHLSRYDGPGITTIHSDFTGVDGYWMNNAGDVLFAEADAVRLFHNGVTTTVASTADGFAALQPSGDGQAFINDAGGVAFWASVTQFQGNPVTWAGVYTGPDMVSDRVLVSGDSVLGHTVNTVELLGLNNSGQMLLHVEAQSPDTWHALVVATPPSADYNHDGIVDAADYVVWRKTGTGGQQGYDLWRANFGNAAGSGAQLGRSTAAIPEPTSASLLLFFVALSRLRRTRR